MSNSNTLGLNVRFSSREGYLLGVDLIEAAGYHIEENFTNFRTVFLPEENNIDALEAELTKVFVNGSLDNFEFESVEN